MMTSAQVVETSDATTDNSPSQDYTLPNDQTTLLQRENPNNIREEWFSQTHNSSCYLKHLLVHFFLVSKFVFVFEIEMGKNSQIDRRIKTNKRKVLDVVIWIPVILIAVWFN